MSASKFLRKIKENILIKIIVELIFRLLLPASVFSANRLELLQDVLKTKLLMINQKQITLYHALLYTSFLFSLFLIIKYLYKKFKPTHFFNPIALDVKTHKYLVEYNGLKWLVGKTGKKYEVSDYPFCPIDEVEFLPKIWAVYIMSFRCPVCDKSPKNDLCVNFGRDIQNILDAKGIKYFSYKNLIRSSICFYK